MPNEAPTGGFSTLPKWETLRDGSGSTYGRRLYVPAYRGWLHQAYLPGPQPLGSALTFAPDFSAWGPPQSSPDLTQVMALLHTINNGVIAMSGTVNSIDSAIADLTADIAAESAVVDQTIVFIQGVPAMVQAAVDAALANGATPAQLAAFGVMKDAMAAEGAKLTAALPSAVPPTPIP